jgi:hypothetical protein
MVAPYQPDQWHDFATAFVGAAGALLGLAFVAISFNLDAILEVEGSRPTRYAEPRGDRQETDE